MKREKVIGCDPAHPPSHPTHNERARILGNCVGSFSGPCDDTGEPCFCQRIAAALRQLEAETIERCLNIAIGRKADWRGSVGAVDDIIAAIRSLGESK